jgi:membrane protein
MPSQQELKTALAQVAVAAPDLPGNTAGAAGTLQGRPAGRDGQQPDLTLAAGAGAVFTVALALFTAFPIFGKAQKVLERWLMDSLIPETIARQVLGYLTQFASKASQLGLVGFSILMVTAIALILTIDRTLNNIWRVRQLRPLGQRVLIYWAAITLGPLLLGLSLVLSSYVMSASKGLVNALPAACALSLIP